MAEEQPKRKRTPKPKPTPPSETLIKPATDPAARERQLTRLAVDLAEKQLREGTAAPSIINHYLKLASSRESIEREILENQSKLLQAKTTSIVKEKETEELAKAAIEAMKNYNGGGR